MIIHRVEHNRRRLRLQVVVCRSGAERARGLLLRRRPDHDTAWLHEPCSAVHTIGMWYRIDVVFCDALGRILRIDSDVLPFRVRRCPDARSAWELAAGGAARLGFQPGDRINPC